MISEVLRHIEDIGTYPVISLLIFVPFFIGVCVMAIRMRREDAEHMSKLPLEEEGA
ncbi:MAG: cbb3-type cytochrome c oxidase subunit 3 [Bacteroidetes bacterium]|jgi:hypothetical protein|nr:cbb3-type cytochrome c oxidase subunit 3 [Bacteroidota bacterium]